jgi:hypothetical protein
MACCERSLALPEARTRKGDVKRASEQRRLCLVQSSTGAGRDRKFELADGGFICRAKLATNREGQCELWSMCCSLS